MLRHRTYFRVMNVVKPKLKHLSGSKERVATEEPPRQAAAARTELAAVCRGAGKGAGAAQASGGLGEVERELVGRFLDLDGSAHGRVAMRVAA